MQKPTVVAYNATVKLAHLREDPDNANVMDAATYEALKQSIAEAGFLQPALVCPVAGKRYVIIDGHHRARAAGEVGLKEIPCVVAKTEDVARRLLNLGMNRLRGEPDLARVAAVVRSLVDQGVTPSDLRLCGYTDEELDVLLRAADEGGGDAVEGAAPAAEDKPPARFVLEIEFAKRDEYRRAKRELKRIAADGDLSRALLSLLD